MKHIYLNIDSDSANAPYVTKILNQKFPLCEESLYPFVDIYKRTNVTDILFNIFCQISLTPSKYITDASLFAQFNDRNHMESSSVKRIRYFNDVYTKYNIDVFDVWIKRCRENGQNPWLSFRMSDTHNILIYYGKDIDCYPKKAWENGWMVGEEYGWFKYCLDYSVPEVRETILKYIEEQLLRYDVYGIELDFMREIIVFKYLTADMKKCTEILTDFMREVKEITKRAEKVHGHEIKILVRTMRDIVQANSFGHDLKTWAREGLVDIINPTSRWAGTDSGIPVKEWQKLCPDVEIVPGLEVGLNYNPEKEGLTQVSAEIARGLCASFLSQGADGVYFYNYFVNPEEEPCDVYDLAEYISILMACSNLDEIYREYSLRFPIIPQGKEGYISPTPLWQPLPATLSENEEKCFEITTGKLPEGKRVWLVIGADKGAEEFSVTLNDEVCTEWSDIDLKFIPGIGSQFTAYGTDEAICKRCYVPADKLTDLVQNIKIKSNADEVKIEWIELYVY